ncbi:MAG: hypothetical protein Q9163_006040 [Psora crenata]
MRTFVPVALAASATAVVAQSNFSVSTVISYYSSCYTAATATVPGTETYTGAAVPHSGEVLTTYTTVFSELCTCSETYTQKTYTITEGCPSASAGQPRESNYVPSGFAVTTTTCHVCAETPITATLTTPVPQAPTAANKAPEANAPAPATTSPPTPPGAGAPGSSDAPVAASPGQPANGAPAAAPASGGSAPAPPVAGGSSNNAAPVAGGSTNNAAPASGGSAPAPPVAGDSSNNAPPVAGGSSDNAGPVAGGPPDNAAPASGGSPSNAGPAALPPYPIPGASGAREAPSPSGSAGSGSSVTPFTGAASRLTAAPSIILIPIGLAYLVL